MNIPLPRFTFLMGPIGEFLAELERSEPTAATENFKEVLSDACVVLGIDGKEAELEEAVRLIQPDFLGRTELAHYKAFADECQMIFHGVRTSADVLPFVQEFGPQSCLIIKLGALLPSEYRGRDSPSVHTVWLPPMEASLQLKHLEAELTRQLAPIEEKPRD
jgi:hypothetical protein